ncbi:dol-P-Glc:Glc(2)Man(9)GlcNAc(2)-PP-Dol alpha-1,2-glucosyltransferase isoform X1 [Apium graveolens]|uniref:dol-P-Glc:Glc(2)Man(9)GlcNAc(2)-PP-Dol alpha-1,2-glucosyltransferase isoform X1 n=2 Tax=Apium graveolens TaxID=4045 RepID=UPI003D7B1BB3
MGRLAVAVIVSCWIIPISILVNRIVPEPYMDEIFHVPQAQQYCRGNFSSWDPMITTPPGLYFLSLAYVASFFPGMLYIQAVPSFFDACSTVALRSTNAVLAVICSIVVYEIISQLRSELDKRRVTLYTVVLALYPLHWFFTYLYYTDVASLTAVLASYLLCTKKNYPLSAVLGTLAVLVRQTNIVWILFVACTGIIDNTRRVQNNKHCEQLDDSSVLDQKDDQSAMGKTATTGSNLRRRRSSNFEDSSDHLTSRKISSSSYSSDLVDDIKEILVTSWSIKWRLLLLFSPYFMLLVAFIGFVYWNGSIVLGAKEAHAVSPHFAQLMYFALISALFTIPVHFTSSQIAVLFQSLHKSRVLDIVLWFMGFTTAFLSVHYFSIAHPYLLADNRHYTFYLWRKIINVHWSTKYLMVPLYVYSWFSIFSTLAKSQKKVWVLVYFLACAAVLIPSPLIEFRYYTIPFFFLILHSNVNSDRNWVLMGILYTVINIFTMAMFLYKPFSWHHEAGTQRFIW